MIKEMIEQKTGKDVDKIIQNLEGKNPLILLDTLEFLYPLNIEFLSIT